MTCALTAPHDCATVRQANDALRRHLNRACDERNRLRRRVAALEHRLRVMLTYAAEWSLDASKGCVWSRGARREGKGRHG